MPHRSRACPLVWREDGESRGETWASKVRQPQEEGRGWDVLVGHAGSPQVGRAGGRLKLGVGMGNSSVRPSAGP